MRRKTHPANGRRRTVPWRNDPEILERVGVVGTLFFQPLATALVAVNQWCRDRGLATISYETIKDDRQRFLETLHDENRAGARARIVELEQMRSAVWRDIAAALPGARRAPLYAEARLLTLAIARMEGSIPPQGLDPVGVGSGARLDDLPSPEELMERGDLAEGDFKAMLRVMAVQISGPPPKLALPAPVGEVIPGSAVRSRREPVAARKVAPKPRRQASPAAAEPEPALSPARRSGVRVFQPS